MLHQHSFKTAQKQDFREADRLPIRFMANVEDGSGTSVPVQVMNISRLGFMAHCDAYLRIGSITMFTAPNGETFPAQIRWALEGRIGCQFQQELSWEDVLGLGLEELSSEDLPGTGFAEAGHGPS